MGKYRVDETGKVFEFDVEYNAYVFCGYLHGRTLEEFVAEYEEGEW